MMTTREMPPAPPVAELKANEAREIAKGAAFQAKAAFVLGLFACVVALVAIWLAWFLR